MLAQFDRQATQPKVQSSALRNYPVYHPQYPAGRSPVLSSRAWSPGGLVNSMA